MLTLIHGDGVTASRTYLLNIKKKYLVDFCVEYKSDDIKAQDLAMSYLTSNLFGDPLLVICDISNDKTFDYSTFAALISAKKTENSLIFYSFKLLPKSSFLLKNAQELKLEIKEFKEVENSSIFAFLDALFECRKKDAYSELLKLYASGTDAFEIWTMLLYGIKNIALAAFEADGLNSLHPFAKSKSQKQAKAFSQDAIKNIYTSLYDYDLKIKTGKTTPEIIIPLVIEKLGAKVY